MDFPMDFPWIFHNSTAMISEIFQADSGCFMALLLSPGFDLRLLLAWHVPQGASHRETLGSRRWLGQQKQVHSTQGAGCFFPQVDVLSKCFPDSTFDND